MLAVWALEIASTLSTRSLELSFAAALSGARGHLNPEGRELEGVLQVVPDVVQQHLSQAVCTNALQTTGPACAHGLLDCRQEVCTLPVPGLLRM